MSKKVPKKVPEAFHGFVDPAVRPGLKFGKLPRSTDIHCPPVLMELPSIERTAFRFPGHLP